MKVLVTVQCNGENCNNSLQRMIDEKYVRKNGTISMGSYCADCRKHRSKSIYRGRTSEELFDAQNRDKLHVKIYSKEEIAEYAKERGL